MGRPAHVHRAFASGEDSRRLRRVVRRAPTHVTGSSVASSLRDDSCCGVNSIAAELASALQLPVVSWRSVLVSAACSDSSAAMRALMLRATTSAGCAVGSRLDERISIV
eukprot:6286722-Prymnesium_polylepis.2